MGANFKDRIAAFVNSYDFLNKVLLPFYNTPTGSDIVKQFQIVNMQRYPNYYAELQGIASGSGVPFINLFLLNLRYELSFFTSQSFNDIISPLNCADVHVINTDNVFVAHNEDAAPEIAQTAYLLKIDIPESNQNFYAYTYPGFLPGVAFGWNKNLSFSFNYVAPATVSVGLGRAFINRDALAAAEVQEALERITPTNRAFGFTLNLGDFGMKKSYTIEVSQNAYAFYENTKNFTHFNEYKLLDIVQVPDISTEFRQARADTFPAPVNVQDALNILGDTMNKQWPIFRNAVPPDHAATVATVLFNLLERTVSVWDTNPKTSSPYMSFTN